MDSDNSEGEVDRRELVNRLRANHACDDTSDVSDDENISHAARSIESPPESPQEAGHFESPPASPESDLHRNVGTPSTPRSPDEPHSPDEPRSPDGLRSPDERSRSSPDVLRPMRGPHSPEEDDRGPHSPDEDDRGPHSPDEDDRGPHSPDEDHRGPRSPDDDRRPRSPDEEDNGDRSLHFRPRTPDDDDDDGLYTRSPASPGSRTSSPSAFRRQPKSPPGSLRDDDHGSPSPPLSPRSPPPTSRLTEASKRLSDSNSDISSNSSFGLPSRRTSMDDQNSAPAPAPAPVPVQAKLKDHAEDLSDVSDLGSLDSVSEDEGDKETAVVDKKLENGERSSSPRDEDVTQKSKDKREPTSTQNSGAGGVTGGLEGDDAEALDFEPGEEREEGECDGGGGGGTGGAAGPAGGGGAKGSDDEGELKGDELEEGELTDEGDVRPEETEPRPVCRFYNRGQCTWGSQCRFLHPGVPDKGNYTMFEMVRPLVPVNGPQGLYAPMDYRPIDRPVNAAVYPQARKEELPVVESAWERGLRQAKEMLRKSSKRKETEVDFEEKKMNLTLSQDELDKENDLYMTRSASPILAEESERRVPKSGDGEGKRYRTMTERFDDYGGGAEFGYGGHGHGYGGRDSWAHARPPPVHYDSHHAAADYHQSSRAKYHSSAYHGHGHHRSAPTSQPPPAEYYEPKRHKRYPPREVIVQRVDKSSSWKDDSPPPTRSSRRADRGGSTGGRGDEWADPWMRSKSPAGGRKTRPRKQSYSSGSSYSSSSSSPSSRSSSYSSFSRDSRSRSRSTRSRSRSRRPVSPSRRLLKSATSPFSRGVGTERSAGKVMSPAVLSEKWAVSEKARHMNPPPPSPRTVKPAPGRGPTSPAVLQRNPTPPSERPKTGLPARLLAHSKAAKAVAAAMRSARSRSKSSHSSSGSDSSGSSSDSSESSLSSSSSSRGPSPSPPTRPKRIVIDDRLALAQAMKVKAMDALKLSGQKQQIKLTLKGSSNPDRPAPTATIAGKKRPLSSPTFDDDGSPPKAGNARSALSKKTAPSRREELLKQLKAVEDAIARKRSKIL